jgi:hypothetical protein
MALNTAHPAVHVNGMIEVNVIWRFVDLNPPDRFASQGALPHQRKPGIIRQHLIVAIHAGRRAGDIRIPGFLDAIMAIPAVETNLVNMDSMREADGLNGLIAHPRVFGSKVIPDPNRQSGSNKHRSDKHPAGQLVRPFWKDIRHAESSSLGFCFHQ